MRIMFVHLLLLSALTWLHCGDDSLGSNGVGDLTAEKATDVKVITLQPETFEEFIEVTGSVEADIATTISSEEQGVIDRFVKDKGESVSAGDIVVILDSEALQASYREAEASYKLSQETFKRQSNLYEDNVISEQKFLEYKYSLDRDRARYENLKAHLENTQIRSPIPGVINGKLAEVGEFVSPGTPLFKVVKTDEVKIRAGVPERHIRDVSLGTRVKIMFDILPEHDFESKITFVGPSLDARTRTFPIEIELANPERLLKPEMFANLRIKKTTVEDAIIVPRDAIIETTNGKYVFVVDGDVARKCDVVLGGGSENRAYVKEGLQAGDRLIVVGHRDLADNEKIMVHQ